MYVAVKGGERAIDSADQWVRTRRRGDRTLAELTVAQIQEQLHRSVARVMAKAAATKLQKEVSEAKTRGLILLMRP